MVGGKFNGEIFERVVFSHVSRENDECFFGVWFEGEKESHGVSKGCDYTAGDLGKT